MAEKSRILSCQREREPGNRGLCWGVADRVGRGQEPAVGGLDAGQQDHARRPSNAAGVWRSRWSLAGETVIRDPPRRHVRWFPSVVIP